MNTQMAPFDNVKVRQAIAAALPYEDMFKAALFERGRRLYGADWSGLPPDAGFPQPIPLTGLDVTTPKIVMDLLSGITTDRGMAMILITHDLGLAASVVRWTEGARRDCSSHRTPAKAAGFG
jgi:ABC-type transport system substrate-binding protein